MDYLTVTSITGEQTSTASGSTRFCTTCGHQNPGSTDICLNCATPLDASCPACGQVVPAGNNFCPECGAGLSNKQAPNGPLNRQQEVGQSLQSLMPAALAQKISAVSGQILGEQREVTVLYTSLVNFDAAPDGQDDEDVYFFMDEALRLLAEVVYKYEGIVDKFTGNGLVALFGAPITHENDPERAVRAALEIKSTIHAWQKRQKQENGLNFQLRLGLNTGPVIAGTVGNNLHMDYTAVGETVNVASQLELMATPDNILISPTTYQYTQNQFEFKTLDSVDFDWLSESIQIFEVVGLQKKSGGQHATSNFQAPMIGRATELANLQTLLGQVQQQGQCRVALVSGQAGLGKSRLVTEFRRAAGRTNVKIFQGSCLNYARSTPLWVVAAIVRDIVGISETASLHHQLENLQEYLRRMNLANNELLPYLSHVLGLGKFAPKLEAQLHQLDATMLQRQTHAALRQLILAETRATPTILIFEDLHWLDSASKDFLDYLIHTMADTSLMLILVAREARPDAVIHPLITAATKTPDLFVNLQLQPLSVSESQLLADHLIVQDTAEAWFLKQQVVKRAEGNPLFVEEITRMLIDQGGLVRQPADGTWQATSKAKDLINTVPRSVKGLILARFDRLPESVRQTLQKATVVGTSFPVSILEQITKIPLPILATHLTELQSRQFVATKPFRSEQGYEFCQTLTQETLYNTLLKQDRRIIHTQVAQAIEKSPLWLPEEQAEILAYHYAESTLPAQAVPYLIAAGENAARRSAYETAIKHYQQAMDLLADPPDSPSNEYFRISIGLGSALKFVGEFASASQVLKDMLDTVESLPAAPKTLTPILVEGLHQLADVRQREGVFDEAMTHLEDGLQALGNGGNRLYPASRLLLMERMAWIRFRQGQLVQAFSLAKTATADLAPDQADPGVLASLYNTLGGISWQQGKLDQAVNYVEQSLDLFESIGYLWGVAIAYGNLGILYYALGNWPKAANYYEQAYAVQQVIGNPEGQALSFDNLGLLHLAMGKFEFAHQELESGLKIRQRLGDAWGTAQSHINLGQVALAQNRFEAAMAHAQKALQIADSIGSPEPQIEGRWLLALAQAETSELQAPAQLAKDALEMARSNGLIEKEIDCLRALGIIHTRANDYDQADRTLQSAVNLAETQNDPYRHALALFELGCLYQQLARRESSDSDLWTEKARTSLTQASSRFRSLGAAGKLEQTQAALSQVLADLPA